MSFIIPPEPEADPNAETAVPYQEPVHLPGPMGAPTAALPCPPPAPLPKWTREERESQDEIPTALPIKRQHATTESEA